MIIILARHGEVDYSNNRDPKLTLTGKLQVTHLAKRLENIEFTQIFSSDLERAKETAKEINKYHSQEIITDKNLREISKYFVDKKNKEEFEHIDSFLNRLNTESDEKILVVCHGHLIRYIISKILSIEFEKTQKIDIIPASITIIKINNNKSKIISINNYEHLPKKLITKN